MGRSSRKSKITWLPLVIYGGSFLRYILKDCNYMVDEGIILVADDWAQSRKFLQEYCKKTRGNGVEVLSWKKRKQHPNNSCCGIMRLKTSTNEEEVSNFLSEKEFLPVVLAGGVLPDYLRCDRYIFRVRREDVEAVSANDFESKVKDFRTYILRNVPEILRVLRDLDTSIALEEYEGLSELCGLYQFLVAIGAVFAQYWRRTHSEREAAEFFEEYLEETVERMGKIPEFASGEEIAEMISSCVWEYMYENEEIMLEDVKAVSGNAYAALKKQKAVLYDEEYYYFPEKLLVEICKSETMSSLELKEKMDELGMIYCYGRDKTVKKTVTLSYGTQKRVRFLWIVKEFLLSPDNLFLEDMFYIENKEELM